MKTIIIYREWLISEKIQNQHNEDCKCILCVKNIVKSKQFVVLFKKTKTTINLFQGEGRTIKGYICAGFLKERQELIIAFVIEEITEKEVTAKEFLHTIDMTQVVSAFKFDFKTSEFRKCLEKIWESVKDFLWLD